MKYHLGTCLENVIRHTQKNVKIAVVANPSHLEGKWISTCEGCTHRKKFGGGGGGKGGGGDVENFGGRKSCI